MNSNDQENPYGAHLRGTWESNRQRGQIPPVEKFIVETIT